MRGGAASASRRPKPGCDQISPTSFHDPVAQEFTTMAHIAIIGAGITGVTTAYSLLSRGHNVTVLDRHPHAAMETSFANGGQLSASNAEVWNSWSTVLKGLRYMLQGDAPLLLNPRPSWHKYSWLAEFMWQISNYRSNTIATVQLAIEARKRLCAIAEREGIDFDLENRGILHIYRDKASFDHASDVNVLLNEGGLDRCPVTPEEMKSIEPTLNAQYYGGFFTPSDATGDIHKFTRGLASVCSRLGGRFVHNVDVRSIVDEGASKRLIWSPMRMDTGNSRTFENMHVDAVVICAGVASREFGAMLGDRLNVYPVKGYSITVHLEDQASQDAAPWVSLLDDSAKIVTSRLGPDRFRVAGTAEFNGMNRDIRVDRIQPLVNWTRRQFPSVSTAQVVPWCR